MYGGYIPIFSSLHGYPEGFKGHQENEEKICNQIAVEEWRGGRGKKGLRYQLILYQIQPLSILDSQRASFKSW